MSETPFDNPAITGASDRVGERRHGGQRPPIDVDAANQV